LTLTWSIYQFLLKLYHRDRGVKQNQTEYDAFDQEALAISEPCESVHKSAV